MPYWDNGTHMGDGCGIVMMLGMLAIWALVAIAIVWMIRAVGTSDAPRTPAGSAHRATTAGAEQTLAERLARGEIDAEEYRTRMDALTARSG